MSESLIGVSKNDTGSVERPEVAQLLDTVNAAGGFLFDFSTLSDSSRSKRWDRPPREEPGTPEADALVKEINTLREEVDELQHAQRQEEEELHSSLLELVGSVAILGRINGDTFELQGGLYHNAPTAREFLHTIVSTLLQEERSEEELEAKTAPLYKQIHQLERKLAAKMEQS